MSVGIDIGSRFLKIAVLEGEGESSFPKYLPHDRRPLETLKGAYEEVGLQGQDQIAITGSLGVLQVIA